MKGAPAKAGAQRKQLAILGVLIVVLVVVVFWMNWTPSTPESSAPAPRASVAPAVSIPAMPGPRAPRTSAPTPMPPLRSGSRAEERSTTGDFRPSLKLKEGTDISRIDPTLRLELIAKLRKAPIEGGARSIFEFSQPPAPPPPKVDPIKPPPMAVNAKAGAPAAAGPPAKPATPPLPPITLKFYGYVNGPVKGAPGASRRAFFLDGDDIFIAGENDVIRNRYKIIRIGISSAVVEDTTNKNQQTLPLVEELAG